MKLRSLLFVPGDRPDRMEKALGSGADALILDLEDAVAPIAKDAARRMVADFLGQTGRDVALFVRVNPLDGGLTDADLDAVVAVRPSGYVLPKTEGSASVRDLDARLATRGDRRAPILPIVSETPRAVFQIGSYADAPARLAGLTWGAEDLPAAIGAETSREDDGSYTAPYRMVRALTLFGAAAAGVAPIETIYPAFRDLDGLSAYARAGARDGFTGMMAIHPAQVPVINAAFTPSDAALAHAHAVIAAFDANPGAGVLDLDGRMVDGPHLKQARALIARS